MTLSRFIAVFFSSWMASLAAEDWSQFRGPRRDGISNEKGFLPKWPEGGPRKLWTAADLGRGFSSPVFGEDRLFVTGDVGEGLRLFALKLDGTLLWTATNGLAWTGDYPGARASAAYSDGRVYLENAHGVVGCYDAETGKTVWSVDLLKKFRGKNITWGLSECLLVDGPAVYATAGGQDAFMVALDKKTGETIWKSDPLEEASYASPIMVSLNGRRLLVGCSLKNLFAMDAASGKFLWKRPMPTSYSVLAMMPTLVNGDSIFMTAPHGKGGFLFRLKDDGFEEAWQSPLDTCQGGVVVVDGKLIGSFYPGRKGWGAIDAKTGRMLFQDESMVKGCVTFADGRLYALSEDGWMRLLEARDDGFAKHGEFRLAQARNDAWAFPVIHRKRLYLRYHETLHCYDIEMR